MVDSYLIFFSLFIVVCPNGQQNSTLTTRDVYKCFVEDGLLRYNISREYFSVHRIHDFSSPKYLVLGITPDCFVYYGWLHKLVLNSALSAHPLRTGYGNLCKDYYSFIIRTEESQELFFIAVKRFGRRILVQSVISPKIFYPSMVTNDLLWMRINPLRRYEQFLTNELELDFTIDHFFNYKYRVFVYGHSTSNIIIKELKLSIDSQKNVAPYITSKSIIIDQMLVIPSAEIHVRVVHDIKYAQGSSNTNFNNEYDGFLYRPKSAEFTVYTSEECKKTIGRFMLYEMRSEREWTVESLPNPEHLFNKISTKQWFNIGRFHRRMAFPHTMHRVVRRNIIYGWKHVAPFVFGNGLLLVIIIISIHMAISCHDRILLRRMGRNHSYSTNSF